jgi:hypothetical protein
LVDEHGHDFAGKIPSSRRRRFVVMLLLGRMEFISYTTNNQLADDARLTFDVGDESGAPRGSYKSDRGSDRQQGL